MRLEKSDRFGVDEFERQLEFLEKGLGKNVDEDEMITLLEEIENRSNGSESAVKSYVPDSIDYYAMVGDREMLMGEDQLMIPPEEVVRSLKEFDCGPVDAVESLDNSTRTVLFEPVDTQGTAGESDQN